MNHNAERIAAYAKARGHQAWICRNPAHAHRVCDELGGTTPQKDCFCHSCEQYHRTHAKRSRWEYQKPEVLRLARSSTG